MAPGPHRVPARALTLPRLLAALVVPAQAPAPEATSVPAPALAPIVRAELHVHLDGAVGLEDLYHICRARGIDLPRGGGAPPAPPASPADVARFIALRPGWHRFDAVNDIIGGDAASIRRAAAAAVGFQARSGVGYSEIRYDPVRLSRSSLLGNSSMSLEATVLAVKEGLAEGALHHGVAAYQILCAMRGRSPDACAATAELAARARSGDMGSVVALDLAGDESSFPNAPYIECFRMAKRRWGLRTTVHAGEFAGVSAEEVRSAVAEMRADRVGHGYAAARDPAVVALLRAKRVHVEACPTSARSHGGWALEAICDLHAAGVSVGLNTDDPAPYIENTTAAEDELIVRERCGFSGADVARAYRAALAAAFGPAAAALLRAAPPAGAPPAGGAAAAPLVLV